MRNIKMLKNNDFMILDFLEAGIDNASSQNFKEFRQTLNTFCLILKSFPQPLLLRFLLYRNARNSQYSF